jgi:hypothetical protein
MKQEATRLRHSSSELPDAQAGKHAKYDTIIRNGRWFDGTGAPSAVRNIGIRNGHVVRSRMRSWTTRVARRSSTRPVSG